MAKVIFYYVITGATKKLVLDQKFTGESEK